MNIRYENHRHHPSRLTFQELVHGRWYLGGDTGRLYFFWRDDRAKPHLLRCDDDTDCTSRYQRGGTFIPTEVTVMVHASMPA